MEVGLRGGGWRSGGKGARRVESGVEGWGGVCRIWIEGGVGAAVGVGFGCIIFSEVLDC